MLPPDNHVHSEFSWTPALGLDGRDCARAVRVGLPAVAFTEHLDFTVWAAEDRAARDGLVDRHPAHQEPIDVEAYAASIAECRDRFPELRVVSGVEAGNRTSSPAASRRTSRLPRSTACSARCTR